MNNFLLILFLIVYCALDALQEYYIERDIATHRDNMSPERRARHAFAFSRTILFILAFSAVIFFQPVFTVSGWKFMAISMLVRGLAMNNFYNLLSGRNFLYVEKENYIAGKVHWLADKLSMPAEVLMLIGYLATIVLIIIL